MKIHSVVDIITNSSSVEYCHSSEHSIDIIKSIISQILLGAGIMENVETLFKIELVPDHKARDIDLEKWDCKEIKITARSGENMEEINKQLYRLGVLDAL